MEESNVSSVVEYAGLGQRCLNCLIDMIVLGFLLITIDIAVIVFLYFAVGTEQLQSNGELLNNLFGVLDAIIFVGFFTCIEGLSKGRTLGKVITGTKAVRPNLQPITWKDAFMRSLCRIIPFEPFSGLLISPAFWHDSLTKTIVIKIRRRPS